MTTFDRPGRAFIWAKEMFGEVATDPRERAMRFLEEAVEVSHSLGLDVDTTLAIVDRVYDRDQGVISRELGQAQITLEVLAKALEVDIEEEANKEFYRIQAVPKAEWERRHAAKQALGIAQPSHKGNAE